MKHRARSAGLPRSTRLPQGRERRAADDRAPRRAPLRRSATRARAGLAAARSGARRRRPRAGRNARRSLREVGFDQRLGEALPARRPVRATRRAARCGSATTSASRPVVLTLVYYECPMLCTLDAQRPGRARSRCCSFDAGPGVRGRHGQLRPEGDAGAGGGQEEGLPRALRAARAPRRGWHFLTGEPAVDRPRSPQRVGFRYAWDEAHAAVRAPGGHRGADAGRAHRALPLRHRVRAQGPALRARRGRRRAGSAPPSTRLLLYCYQYDPHDRPLQRRDHDAILRAGRAHRPGALGAFIVVDAGGASAAARRAPPGAPPSAMRSGFPLFPEQASTIAGERGRALLLPRRGHRVLQRCCIAVAVLVLRGPLPAPLATTSGRAEIHGSLALELDLDAHPARDRASSSSSGARRSSSHLNRVARRRHGGQRGRQALDVEGPAHDRPARDQRAARAGGRAGQARRSPPRT